jgi:hypothetical protein
MPQVRNISRFAFIVGAPRCGTTTLADFLKSHPDVCFPVVKESHFFAQNDLAGMSSAAAARQVEEEYLARFFPHAGPGTGLAADCSVSYLYTPEQLEPALRLWPESRFIVTLRDPMEMLPSLHKRLIFLGDETLMRFADAWDASPDRAAGRRIPRSCIDPRWLRYDEAARYATYLERLFATVGRERVLVLLFDDLAADPFGQYRRIMRFLDLPLSHNTVDLSPRRKSQDVRSARLQRLLKRPPRSVRKFMAGSHFRTRERKLGGDLSDSAAFDALFALRKRLLTWNRVPARKRPIQLRVQEEIRSHLKSEIARLQNLIDRDLGHWLQVRPHDEPATEQGSSKAMEPSYGLAA